MRRMQNFLLITSIAVIFFSPLFAQDYYVYVAAESDDKVHLIHFDAEKGRGEIAETIVVGRFPTETDGPHGITVAPDGKYWFVSIAHGNPYGMLAKYETETNSLVGTVDLGMFPATMEISPVTGLLYVVNFNLHGEMKPSTVMVVDPETMAVVTEIETGIMPHGSRISSDGHYQYHTSMMTDELIQIDTRSLSVTKRFSLSKNASGHQKHADLDSPSDEHNSHQMAHNPVEKPTWAHPHPTKPLVYVAGNGSDEIIEVDVENWKITRRFNTAKAPYNLEVSDDGKLLVVSYKGDASTGIWNLNTGKEIAKIQNSRKVTHGVAISDDSRFTFISVEGIGGEPGSVDIIDLKELSIVDIVETGKQAGGIYMWNPLNN